MRAISVWQPFATLIVKGYKIFETRTWHAPSSVIGQRIGIASTKTLRPEQRAHFADETFQGNYQRLLLPERLEDLPHGYMLGTAVLDSVELMTEEFIEEVSNEEQSYGWWQPEYYAWRMVSPEVFPRPIRFVARKVSGNGDISMRFDRKKAVRLIRNGRRVYGGVYRLPDGREVYIAYRKQDEIFRAGEKTIKDAMDKGVAAWALDYDTLIRLRTEGVYLVGIQTKETGDLYLTTLGEFNKAPMLNYESRGGALQRYLPFDKFLVQLGSVKPPAKASRRSAVASVS